MKRKIRYILLAAMFCFFLFLELLLMNTSPDHFDAAYYLSQIEAIVEGKRKLFEFNTFQYIHELYFVLSAIFFRIFGIFNLNVEKTTLLMSIILGAFIPLLIYKIVKNLYSSDFWGFIAGFLIMFNPLVLWYSNEIMTDLPTLFFITLSFLLLTEFFIKPKNYKLILASFILGACLLLRFSSFFVFPAFIFLLFIKSDKSDKIKNILLSLFFFITPISFYIIFNNYYLQDFLYVDWQAKASLANFNLTSLKILAISLINIFTSFFVLTLVLGFIAILILFFKRKIKTKEFNLKIIFPLVWLIPFSIYSLFLPIFVCRYTRHFLLNLPGFILLFTAILFYLKPYFNKKIMGYIFFTASFCFLLDWTIINNIDFYTITDFFLIVPSLIPFILKFVLIIGSIFIFVYIAFYYFSNKFKKHQEKLNLLFILFIICVTSFAYTFPTLYLNHTKINSEKAVALWFAQNTPENAVIAANHEWPFDNYYVRNRTIINPFDKNSTLQTKNYLDNSYSIYFSENYPSYLEEFINNSDYEIIKVGTILKEILRNQKEGNNHFMNYWLSKQAHDIRMFVLKKK
ncbi:MAG: glycosyltransferase family 39 protein [Candidatus Pacearchaeota archaeon]